MSPLSTYLRTRRFNRPTFGLTRHTNLWKNTAFRDFSNIWRGRIFFLLTFWLLHLLSTDLITLLLLFNSPYCRKFLFKLPSINISMFICMYTCIIYTLLYTYTYTYMYCIWSYSYPSHISSTTTWFILNSQKSSKWHLEKNALTPMAKISKSSKSPKSLHIWSGKISCSNNKFVPFVRSQTF